LAKGLFALSETLCGVVLVFLNPERMARLIDFINKDELYEDPADFVIWNI